MKFALGFCALTTLLLRCDARPSFVALIPNGNGVTGVAALGHVNAAGGGRTNPFGEAFGATGREWTKELCEADSDGDGATNGEELGDPCCTWTPLSGFDGSSSSAVPTHPGVANSFSTEQLASMTCGGEADLNAVASSGSSSSLTASGSQGSTSSSFGSSSSSGSFDDVVAPTLQPRFSPGPKLDQTSPTPATSDAESLKTSVVVLCCSIIALALAM